MRHSYFGKKLSRTNDERKRLFRSLLCDLFVRGSIVTTKAKAKAIQPNVDRLITKAKQGKESGYEQLLQAFNNASIAHQLLIDAKGRFSARNSGYTRMIKLSEYRQDAAEQVKLSFVDELVASDMIKPYKETKKSTEKTEMKKEDAKKEKPKVTKKIKK